MPTTATRMASDRRPLAHSTTTVTVASTVIPTVLPTAVTTVATDVSAAVRCSIIQAQTSGSITATPDESSAAFARPATIAADSASTAPPVIKSPATPRDPRRDRIAATAPRPSNASAATAYGSQT